MTAAIRYVVVGAMIVVAMIGIPLIFPSKGNPFKGKAASVAAEELRS